MCLCQLCPRTPCRCPQWSDDEQLSARNVTNEVHCFEGGAPGNYSWSGIVFRLHTVDKLRAHSVL